MTVYAQAIANYRVSTYEQLENNSISKQERMINEAADALNAKVVQVWSGYVSSKKGRNVTRKDLNEMLEFCKKNRQVKYAIFDEVDRFMRAMLELGYFFVEFQKLGVEVKFASQPNLGTDTATDTLLLMLEAFKAEGSNEERWRKSVGGQVNAIKEGRYPYRPILGYRKGQVSGLHELDNTVAPILKNLLIRISSQLITPTNALKEFNQSDFMAKRAKLKMDKFRSLIIHPYYAGIVEMDKQVKARNEHGLHDALITIEQHNEIVRIVESKGKNQVGPRKNGNPEFPLDNILHCLTCGDRSSNNRYVGFKHTNGVTSKIYMRYRCRGIQCKRYLHAEDVHGQVKSCFEHKPMTEGAKKDLRDALEKVWKQQEFTTQNEITRLHLKAKKLRETISNHIDAMALPSNESIVDEIRNNVTDKKVELQTIERQVEELERTSTIDKAKFLKFALNYVDDLSTHFFELPRDKQLVCKQLVFPAGFWVDENKKVYTPEISELYRLATRKKDTEVSENSLMVRVRRL